MSSHPNRRSRGDETLGGAERDRECLDAALRFLSHRQRSEREVRRRLVEKGHDSDRIDRVVQRLKELDLVDDREFADYWLTERQLHKPRGERALRAELFQKGVPREVVDEALAAGERNELDDAYRAAEKRAAQLSALDEAGFRQRLGQFLLRRGFDWETVTPVVDRLWREHVNERIVPRENA
jgi:regulatory protein